MPSVSGISQANSSPPRRASTSPSRTREARRSAASRSTASPTTWPWTSLTSLNWSRSSTASARSRPWRRERATSSARRSSKTPPVDEAGQRVGGRAPGELGARLGVADRQRHQVGEALQARARCRAAASRRGRSPRPRRPTGGRARAPGAATLPRKASRVEHPRDGAGEGAEVVGARGARRCGRPGSRAAGSVSGTVRSRGGHELRAGRPAADEGRLAVVEAHHRAAGHAVDARRAPRRPGRRRPRARPRGRRPTAMRRRAACSRAARRRSPGEAGVDAHQQVRRRRRARSRGRRRRRRARRARRLARRRRAPRRARRGPSAGAVAQGERSASARPSRTASAPATTSHDGVALDDARERRAASAGLDDLVAGPLERGAYRHAGPRPRRGRRGLGPAAPSRARRDRIHAPRDFRPRGVRHLRAVDCRGCSDPRPGGGPSPLARRCSPAPAPLATAALFAARDPHRRGAADRRRRAGGRLSPFDEPGAYSATERLLDTISVSSLAALRPGDHGHRARPRAARGSRSAPGSCVLGANLTTQVAEGRASTAPTWSTAGAPSPGPSRAGTRPWRCRWRWRSCWWRPRRCAGPAAVGGLRLREPRSGVAVIALDWHRPSEVVGAYLVGRGLDGGGGGRARGRVARSAGAGAPGGRRRAARSRRLVVGRRLRRWSSASRPPGALDVVDSSTTGRPSPRRGRRVRARPAPLLGGALTALLQRADPHGRAAGRR